MNYTENNVSSHKILESQTSESSYWDVLIFSLAKEPENQSDQALAQSQS